MFGIKTCAALLSYLAVSGGHKKQETRLLEDLVKGAREGYHATFITQEIKRIADRDIASQASHDER